MKAVGFWGLRGGVGTTSVVAMVADALQRAGQSVLMIDLNPSDALRLHFNVPYADSTGWAHAHLTSEPWNQHVFEITENLFLLPYGRCGVPDHLRQVDPAQLSWLTELSKLKSSPQWILLDMPCTALQHPVISQVLDMNLMVTCVDAGCHVLLSQRTTHKGTRLVANMQDPSRTLCNDLLLEWTSQYHNLMVPVIINRDESVHESLALKSPVTQAFPASSAAQDAHSLATWLSLHFRQQS